MFERSTLDRLDLLDWSQTGAEFDDYEQEGGSMFSEDELVDFFWSPLHQARRQIAELDRPLLRVASQDSGAYLACLRNPLAYGRFERKLVPELSSAVGCPVLQLCYYEVSDLIRAGTNLRGGVVARIRLLWSLLVSHDLVGVLGPQDRQLRFDRMARLQMMFHVIAGRTGV
jgi:hypothetical protein